MVFGLPGKTEPLDEPAPEECAAPSSRHRHQTHYRNTQLFTHTVWEDFVECC